MAEWLLRNSVTFVLLVLVTRWLATPRLGKRGVIDMFMVNAIGDLAAHTVFEEQHPMLPGLASIIAWVGLTSLMSFLIARWRWLRHTFYHPPFGLVKDGRSDQETMKRHNISSEEMEFELREHGAERIDQVKQATLEPDGSISLLKEDATATELKRLARAIDALTARLELHLDKEQPPRRG